MGRKSARMYDGIEGKGISKKRMSTGNRLDRGSNFASTRKDADLLFGILLYEGCKIMRVSYSTISAKDKKLTNAQLRHKWQNIDWHKVEKGVNNLQTRITKAVKANKWLLVKKLQYLLTHSYYAKLLAVRRITRNRGKRTAGIDGERWTTSESKMKAVFRLTNKGYKAKPLRRVFIIKAGKKKKRPLGIPTMHDRAMQYLYALSLEPVTEATSDLRSFGFRKYRSTKDCHEQAFLCLCKVVSPQWVLEGDIRGCFDNINHQWLLDHIPMDKSILRQFLKAGFVYKRHLNPTKAGTPQGGLISPLLANMALDGIEELLRTRYPKKGKMSYKVNFVRYADDFIITAVSEDIAKEIKVLTTDFLKKRGLELSNEKTLITNINDGFDFLGWNFRKYNGKLLIKPSRQSIKKFTENLSKTIHQGKNWSQVALIDKLNPMIRGWTNYHKSSVSSKIFQKLDSIIWGMLWTWAKRRHPDKSKHWIANKYWEKSPTRLWNFRTQENELLRLSHTKIRRHRPLKLDMNPFLNQDYFQQRKNQLKFSNQNSI